ncbi:MAG: hypothetical protein Greene071421_31 [Parcubacteria group bacterium Greene0714_21]|nr:MAG: hypothetical protein Greene041639_429 [Parcubacteria group bacterium Greene0416_39]TSC97938.1 MAG: hypothetical protein Greene101447_236 [Parcubacteria group bacterium Greene1014_47]TSD04545.1 MAG: hypothetical protein Greene071421_31 [Parcubacteria group bacterium Greene0714_21]
MWYNNRHISEIFLLLAGATLLLSLPFIFFTGSFFAWMVGKIFYGIGVLLFLFQNSLQGKTNV